MVLSQPLPLPPELLPRVAVHLDPHDYGSLRLSCRGIEANTFDLFGRRFFTECHVMRTKSSLQAFIDISKSDMSSFVRAVILGMELPRRDVNQSTGLPNDIWRGMLTEALGNLTSPISFRIRNLPASFDGLRKQMARLRDHPALQRCIGHKMGRSKDPVFRSEALEFGDWAIFPHRHRHSGFGSVQEAQAECWRQVLLALSESNVKLKALELLSYRTQGFESHRIVLPQGSQRIKICSLLHQLRSVTLDVQCVDVKSPNGDSTHCLRQFLTHVSQVENLRLDFTTIFSLLYDNFLDWLAAPSTSSAFPLIPAVAFPCLRHLSLCSLQQPGVSVDRLLSVLRKFGPNLQSLELVDMGLAESDNSDPWAKVFLPALKAKFGDTLISVRFSRISQPGARLGFKVPCAAKDCVDTFYYSGSKMKEALDEAMRLLAPGRPPDWGYAGVVEGTMLPGKLILSPRHKHDPAREWDSRQLCSLKYSVNGATYVTRLPRLRYSDNDWEDLRLQPA